MERTTIVAEEQVLYRIRQLADERGVSMGEIIREALEEKLSREQPPLRSLGSVAGREGPSARQFDEEDLYRPDDHRSGE